MATAGPNNASAVSNVAGAGVDWTNPTNAQGAEDGVFATVTLAGEAADRLLSGTYGFALDAGSTIISVLYEIHMKNTLNYTVQLFGYWSGAEQTAAISFASGFPNDTLRWVGGTIDATLPTVSQANGTDFGAAFNTQVETATVSVDAFRITITYTAGGWAPAWPGMNVLIQNIRRWFGWKPKQYTQTRGCGEIVAV